MFPARVGWEVLAGQSLGPPAGQERSVPGQGKPRARQRWNESPGRGQESQFHFAAKFMQKKCCCWVASGWPRWGGLGAVAGQERSGPGQWRARQRWTESPGRGQESQFHIPAKFVHLRCSWSALGWLGRPWDSHRQGEVSPRPGEAESSPMAD